MAPRRGWCKHCLDDYKYGDIIIRCTSCPRSFHRECIENELGQEGLAVLDTEGYTCDSCLQYAQESEIVNDERCKICRERNRDDSDVLLLCDGCPNSYHMSCLDLQVEPDTEKWYCPMCKPEAFERVNLRRRNPLIETSEHVNSSICYVCQRHGKLLGCDFCPNSFHYDCLPEFDIDTIGDTWECPCCRGEDPFINQMHKRWTIAQIEKNSKTRRKCMLLWRGVITRYRNRFILAHRSELSTFVTPKIMEHLMRSFISNKAKNKKGKQSDIQTHLELLQEEQSIESNKFVIKARKSVYYPSGRKKDNRPMRSGVTLKPHQEDGVDWLLKSFLTGGAILADEMGLGKTIQTLCFLSYLKMMNIEGPHLIVVPLSTVGNWLREIHRFTPHLTVIKICGSKTERQHAMSDRLSYSGLYDLFVTTYETVKCEEGFFVETIPRWQCLILDEAHRIKNQSGAVRHSMDRILSNMRLLLTGTPLQNNAQELFTLINFMFPDLFRDSEIMERAFNAKRRFSHDDEMEFTNKDLEAIKLLLSTIMLRRLKEQAISLPKKVYHDVWLPLSNETLKWYRMLMNIKSIMKENVSIKKLLGIVIKMRIVCGHPRGIVSRTPQMLKLFEFFEQEEAKVLKKMEEEANELKKLSGKSHIHASAKLTFLDKLLCQLHYENCILVPSYYKKYNQHLRALDQSLYRQHSTPTTDPNPSNTANSNPHNAVKSQPTGNNTVMVKKELGANDNPSGSGTAAANPAPVVNPIHTLLSGIPLSTNPNFKPELGANFKPNFPGAHHKLNNTNIHAFFSTLPKPDPSVKTESSFDSTRSESDKMDLDDDRNNQGSEVKNETDDGTNDDSKSHEVGQSNDGKNDENKSGNPNGVEKEPKPRKRKRLSKHEVLSKLDNEFIRVPSYTSTLEMYLSHSIKQVNLSHNCPYKSMKIYENALEQENKYKAAKKKSFKFESTKLVDSLPREEETMSYYINDPNKKTSKIIESDDEFESEAEDKGDGAEDAKDQSDSKGKSSEMELDDKEGAKNVDANQEQPAVKPEQHKNGDVGVKVEPSNANNQPTQPQVKKEHQRDKGDEEKGNKIMMHKVLVFTQFQLVLDELEKYCINRGWKYMRLDGSTNKLIRELDIREFNSPNSNYFVYLISTRAGGLGINLTAANHVVLYDEDWNPFIDLQAIDRAHRIGQKRTVHIWKLISEWTVEERMALIREKKLQLDKLILHSNKDIKANATEEAAKYVNTASLINAQNGEKRMDEEDMIISLSHTAILKMMMHGNKALQYTDCESIVDLKLDQIVDRKRKAPPEHLDDTEDVIDDVLVGTGNQLEGEDRVIIELVKEDEEGDGELTPKRKRAGLHVEDLMNEEDVKPEPEATAMDSEFNAENEADNDGDNDPDDEDSKMDPKDLEKFEKRSKIVMEMEKAGLLWRSGREKKKPTIIYTPTVWHRKSETKVLKHENKCFSCGKARNYKAEYKDKDGNDVELDYGDLIRCFRCPKSYHKICENLTTVKKTWSCRWHECCLCFRKSSQCGNLLIHCSNCPTSFCYDCFPPDYSRHYVPDEYYFSLNQRGMAASQTTWIFFLCSKCKIETERKKRSLSGEERDKHKKEQKELRSEIISTYKDKQDTYKETKKIKLMHNKQEKGRVDEMKAQEQIMEDRLRKLYQSLFPINLIEELTNRINNDLLNAASTDSTSRSAKRSVDGDNLAKSANESIDSTKSDANQQTVSDSTTPLNKESESSDQSKPDSKVETPMKTPFKQPDAKVDPKPERPVRREAARIKIEEGIEVEEKDDEWGVGVRVKRRGLNFASVRLPYRLLLFCENCKLPLHNVIKNPVPCPFPSEYIKLDLEIKVHKPKTLPLNTNDIDSFNQIIKTNTMNMLSKSVQQPNAEDRLGMSDKETREDKKIIKKCYCPLCYERRGMRTAHMRRYCEFLNEDEKKEYRQRKEKLEAAMGILSTLVPSKPNSIDYSQFSNSKLKSLYNSMLDQCDSIFLKALINVGLLPDQPDFNVLLKTNVSSDQSDREAGHRSRMDRRAEGAPRNVVPRLDKRPALPDPMIRDMSIPRAPNAENMARMANVRSFNSIYQSQNLSKLLLPIVQNPDEK